MEKELLNKFNEAIENNNDFAAIMIYTRLKNLGYELVFEEKINLTQ